MPVVVQPNRENIPILLILDGFEGYRAFPSSIEVVSHEL